MMRRIALLMAVFGLVVTTLRAQQLIQADNTLTKDEVKQGWKLLFDGKSNAGWIRSGSEQFPDHGWEISQGVLKVLKNGRGGDILTSSLYKNFILKVDFKITPGANSGIKYFVVKSGIGCEYQILDDNMHPDAKAGVAGNRTLGSLYDLIPAPGDKPYKDGEFNTATIVVANGHVEHWLNGVKILEYERYSQMFRALVNYSKYKPYQDFGSAERGHILLQDHGDEVWYKNIKILEKN